MEFEVGSRLVQELRDRVSDLLAAVQLLTPLVREKGDGQDTECLAAINKSLYQMIRTIQHIELCGGDGHTYCPELVDLAGLCRDLGRQVELLAEDLGISFRWELEKESVCSLADEELLTRAILNLLTNAFTAAGKGGKVFLRCAVSGDRCLITVGDNGPGLKEREVPEDPFLKQPGGVGLGLAAAREVAALHGGALVLENGEEHGVRAVLSLPVRMPEKSEHLRERIRYEHSGGFSPLLVEFSPLLPLECFEPKQIE